MKILKFLGNALTLTGFRMVWLRNIFFKSLKILYQLCSIHQKIVGLILRRLIFYSGLVGRPIFNAVGGSLTGITILGNGLSIRALQDVSVLRKGISLRTETRNSKIQDGEDVDVPWMPAVDSNQCSMIKIDYPLQVMIILAIWYLKRLEKEKKLAKEVNNKKINNL